jgi:hypothetical protein
VPFGIRSIVRGWPILLAAAPPLGTLLVWQRPAGTCIAFQYVTCLIPVLCLAALAGAAGDRRRSARDPASDGGLDRSLQAGAVGALVAGVAASTLFGAMPWSSSTHSVLLARTYVSGDGSTVANPRAPGTSGGAALDEMVALVRQPQAAVLASGRAAAHLLGVRRLESVEEGTGRWKALAGEAGAGHTAVEVFDWVLLDVHERFQQSEEKLQFCRGEALRAGYEVRHSEAGIELLARPDSSRAEKRTLPARD